MQETEDLKLNEKKQINICQQQGDWDGRNS